MELGGSPANRQGTCLIDRQPIACNQQPTNQPSLDNTNSEFFVLLIPSASPDFTNDVYDI